MPPEVDTPREAPNRADLLRAEQSLLLPDGARLCLCSAGLALFSSDSATEGHWLSAGVHARLDGGAVWRRLELGDKRYTVNSSTADQALRMVGLARLRAASRGVHRALGTTLDALTAAAVDVTLEANDPLLFCAPTEVKLEGESAALGSFRARAELVVSEHRCVLLAVSKAGDVVSEPLLAPFRVEGKLLVSASRRLTLPSSLLAFADVFRLEGAPRILEAARLGFASGRLDSGTHQLVAAVAARGDSTARWVEWFLERRGNPAVPCPPDLDMLTDVNPAELWERWGFSDALASAVLADLPRSEGFDLLAETWAERIWRRQRQEGGDRLEADLGFVEQLVLRGQNARARDLADSALATLPKFPTDHVERPGVPLDVDGQRRRRLLELRLECGEPGADRVEARLQLLRLQPLEAVHLGALAAEGGALGERAGVVLRCLTQATPRDPASLGRRSRPLPADVLERRLRADLAVDTPKLPERVKSWIANEPRPDQALLKQFCERVTRADAPIVGIVDQAATLLGLGLVEIYVSRGDDDVGVRAFDGARPFILIGGRHLDEATTYAMTPRELGFAVGSELLHLRIGNVRVGTRDVVRGALQKGRAGLEVAISVLPLLKGLKLADKLGMLTARVSLPHVGRALDAGRQALGQGEGEPQGLSPAAETLLTMQRELQLWADRAGLLCSGAFDAALRAMAITRHDTARAARDLERRGALVVFDEQRAGEREAFDYLLLRVASLSRFYVSEEYGALAAALDA